MTATLEERLKDYEVLCEEIHNNYQHGRPFIQTVLIGLTLNAGSTVDRDDYIINMGKHFNIPADKVERVIALLPA